MKKRILSIIFALLLMVPAVASAEFFSDIIVTSPNGIWTDSRAYETLNAAITAVGANDREIMVVNEQVVTNLVIPANVRLKFLRDGSINNSGQLNINTRNIIADDRQIFTGTGDIDFVAGSVVRSAWFSDIVETFDVTDDDTLTLIISEQEYITVNSSVGNNVQLKWESPQNKLLINPVIELSNIGQIEAGNYQLFAGAGDFDFLDGTVLNLSWFRRLRSVVGWVESEEVTLEVSDSNVVSYDNTVPNNLSIKILNGADLNVDGGRTLTINSSMELDGTITGAGAFVIGTTGSLYCIDGIIDIDSTINGRFEAGLYRVFDGSITVAFGGDGVVELYPHWWGAVADGATDSSTAILAALDQTVNKIVILPPSSLPYILLAEHRLAVNSNTKISGYGATLFKHATAANPSMGFWAFGTVAAPVVNVHIEGLIIDGNRAGRVAPAYANGAHLIRFQGVTDSSIVDVTVKNGLADGLLIASDETNVTTSKRIRLDNVVSDNNYRQGMSVAGVDHMTVTNSTFSNTNGQAPEAGVDLEPDAVAVPNTNVWFYNCNFVDNAGIGLYQPARSNNCGLDGGMTSGNNAGVAVGAGANSESLTIRNMYINETSTGIQIDAPNCIVENNRVTSSAGDRAIHLMDDAHRTVVTGNIINGTASRAIYVESDYNIIHGNQVYEAGLEGIYLIGTPSYNTISDNIIIDSQLNTSYSMYIRGVSNKVSGNIIMSSLGAAGGRGVAIVGTGHEVHDNFVEGCNPVSGKQFNSISHPFVVSANNNWDGTLAMFIGLPYCTVFKTVDLAVAGNNYTIYNVPANSSFIPDSIVARIDNDIAATNGDYWSIGVNANNRRVDYGVCATVAAANKHSANAKIRWLNSSELVNQVSTVRVELLSVDGTGDAAAIGNNIGGAAGDTVTIIIRGRLVEDIPDF